MTTNVTLAPYLQSNGIYAAEEQASTHSPFGQLIKGTLDPQTTADRDTPSNSISHLPYLDYPIFYIRKTLRTAPQQPHKRREKQQ